MKSPVRDLSVSWNKLPTYLYYVMPAFLLLVAVVYSSWHANLFYSNIQDAILYPYLFSHYHLHDIIVPAQHANILKFPLFWLQSVLPYNYTTLTIVDIGLAIVSIAWWAILLVVIFGRRYAPVICSLLFGVVIASVSLSNNFVETSIRNIEYPIGLSFILIISVLLKKARFTRKEVILGGIISLLFALSVAGDNLILTSFSVPLLAILGLYWLQTGNHSKQWLRAVGLVVLVSLGGLIIRKLVFLSGVVTGYYNMGFHIVPIHSFAPSLGHATSQLLNLSGGSITSQALSPGLLLYMLNLLALIVGIGGLVFALIHATKRFYRGKTMVGDDSFLWAALATSFFATFATYIFSNLVVTETASGTFVDSSQIRYISLMPLLVVVGVAVLLKHFYAKRSDLRVAVVVIFMVAAVFAIPVVRNNWVGSDQTAHNTRTVINNVVREAKQDNVQAIVSGDTLGATVRFWSHNTIQYVSIIDCNQPFQINTRLSWRKPATGVTNTALVIDTTGVDALYWQSCQLQSLQGIYGQPAAIKYVANPMGTQPIQMWIYHYDIRQKLIVN